MRIGVDLMGGESSPQDLFCAVLEAHKELKKGCTLCIFCTSPIAQQLVKLVPRGSDAIEFLLAEDEIGMDESPTLAVRRKKDASILVGMRALAAKQIDALVSSGNTGALVVAARLSLPLLPTIERPGLLALVPTKKGLVSVIDVGGNVDCSANHLISFARMGIAFQRSFLNKPLPRVALLNIGVESIKGTSQVRLAYQMLQAQYPHFVGNLEGREIFQGEADVIVTDGFSGNVFLKTSEGISLFILEMLKEELKSVQVPHHTEAALKKVEEMVNYEKYFGAILCGVEGIVIKCHGASTMDGLLSGIRGAIQLVENRISDKFKEALS